MLYGEIAIHPDCLEVTMDRLSDLDSKFGFDTGALVSNLPRRLWAEFKAKVQAQLITGEGIESKIAEEILVRLECAFVKFGRRDPQSKAWFSDISKLDEEKKFHAIVSLCQSGETYHYYQLNNVISDLGDDKETPKVASKFIPAIAPLIKVSKTISFIDPYIYITKVGDSWKSTYKPFFEELLQHLKLTGATKVIEIHKEDRTNHINGENISVEEQKKFFKQYLLELCPDNVEINIFWWDDENTNYFHARHVVSEVGAVKFDGGFPQPYDLDKQRQPADMSVVSSMKSIKALLSKFDPFESDMQLIDQITINQLK